MKVYWYAPFNNALELEVASSLAERVDDIVFHSLHSRFGKQILEPGPGLTPGNMVIVRDLPEPAGEAPDRKATRLSRALVALERSRRRANLLSGDFDLAHIHTYNMFTDWVALNRLPESVPLLLTIHNVRPHERRGPELLESVLHRLGYQSASHIVVAHDYLREQLVADFGISGQRISVIPLAIPPLEGQGVRKTAPDSPDSTKTFLMFGTLRANKGTDVLLEAIRLIPRDSPLRFHFAGRGDPQIARRLREAERQDPRINAEIGWVSPARQDELFRSAWAVVLPYTDYSAQSGVLRESYAYGLPTIASDIGALGAEVRTEATGWLVAPGDPVGLADVLQLSASSVEERLRISGRARGLAITRSPTAIATQLIRVYRHMLQSPR